jgi:hypothetical protein
VLRQHVTLEVESIDRMYLNAIVPRLQIVEGALRFIRQQRKAQVASTNAVEPMTRAFVQAIEQFVEQQGIPMVSFQKGQRKDGVVFVGKAQEKCTGIVKSTALVNHYYFYCVDENFGPFFLKFCSYFPYNAKLCLNGHEYAKQQLEREGIAYQALDNGIRSCAEPKRLQQICDALSAAKVDAPLRKWLRRLPHPYPAADRAAGYRYQLSIRQIELSLTQVLERQDALRTSDSRESRSGAAQTNTTDLRPQRHQSHARALPHARHYRRRDPFAAHRLQRHAHQAVSQARPSPAHRNHHQQHARLLPRQEPP